MSVMQGVQENPASVMVALSGLITVFLGYRMSRSGQRNERHQQTVANELQKKAQDHDYYKDLVRDQREELDRKDKEIARIREQYAQDMGYQRDVSEVLRDVVRSEIAKTLAEDAMDAADRALDPEDDDKGL